MIRLDGRPLRVAILTGPFSATYNAQVAALRERINATVEVVYRRAQGLAPYHDEEFEALQGALSWDGTIPAERIRNLVDRLQPDLILVTSWNYRGYVHIARTWRHAALRVMIMDNQWRSTLKQWAGIAISPIYLRPAFDVVFLPNELQRIFARKLGFGDDQIWDGVYCCDQPRFEVQRASWPEEPRTFLYAGRLVALKGVDVLLRAYASYRTQVEKPWPLQIVGTGPLEEEATAAEGVVTLGFRQPAAMPEVFAHAGCFVLPSIVEPWGIVIHEAAASGLPIICTTACGASLDLVRDGYNGFVVAPGNDRMLASAMVSVSSMSVERRRAMSGASTVLSRQLTPERWADTLDERTRAWLERRDRLAGRAGTGSLGQS